MKFSFTYTKPMPKCSRAWWHVFFCRKDGPEISGLKRQTVSKRNPSLSFLVKHENLCEEKALSSTETRTLCYCLTKPEGLTWGLRQCSTGRKMEPIQHPTKLLWKFHCFAKTFVKMIQIKQIKALLPKNLSSLFLLNFSLCNQMHGTTVDSVLSQIVTFKQKCCI